MTEKKIRPWAPQGACVSLVPPGTSTFGLGLFHQDFINPRTPDKPPETFVTFTKKPGTTICTVTHDGRLVLVRQFQQGAEIVAMEFPAGLALKDEETSALAIKRLREETGYEAREFHPLHTHPILIAPRKSPSGFDLFAALGCTQVGEQDLTDREEDIEVIIVSPSEFWSMVQRGEIRSAETLLAAYMSAAHGFIPGPHVSSENQI